MHWLAKQPAWQKSVLFLTASRLIHRVADSVYRSREFETTTRTTTVGINPSQKGFEEDDEDEQDDPEDELTPGKQKVKVVFQPTFGQSHASCIVHPAPSACVQPC